MAFPDKKRLLFWSKPEGWEDLGEVGGEQKMEGGRLMELVQCHTFCCTTAHVGKEEGALFLFCPKCLIKIKAKSTP